MRTSGQQVERLEKGQRKLTQEWIDRAAEAFGVDPTTIITTNLDLTVEAKVVHTPLQQGPAPDHPPTRSVDAGETASVMRMDLSYALGPGTNIDHDFIEGEPVELDISLLRQLTPSAPSLLRIVNGIGDSMFPTIHDREDLVLDLGQRTLNLQDRIWALSLYGTGAVKRLKAIGRDRVLVISDNPDVPDQEVDTGDIILVGRIVGSIRRH